jgi:hypothetical protein
MRESLDLFDQTSIDRRLDSAPQLEILESQFTQHSTEFREFDKDFW